MDMKENKKVLIGQFITESNANIPDKNELNSYEIAFGEDLIEKMQVRDIFEEHNIEIIPSIYAISGASGVIKEHTFNYIESCLLRFIKEHLHEIDGIYLMLHGASEVERIGSGEHHIMKEIRKIVGDYIPITVACDPHGNLCKEYVESITMIRSYRESPHTDAVETWRKVAKTLCDLLENRQNIHSVYRKLPLILGGEQSVSKDEPVKSINAFMDKLEKDPRVLSCSWHVGYIRHDSEVNGCGIVVVPATEKDQLYAEDIADELSKYVWDRRHEFHYTGLTAEPEEALKMALDCREKPVVITDSGDNTTSGATGWNTYILRQFLNVQHLNKRVLFAAICDPKTFEQLDRIKIGTNAHIALGTDYDELSKSVDLDVTVISKGDVIRPLGVVKPLEREDKNSYTVFGKCVVVRLKDKSIDVIVSNHRQSYFHQIQFKFAGIHNWTDYDIVVVKQGYIFPELKEKAAFYVMSLTDGATPQNTAAIPFKRIMRPMYPIDNI